MTGPVILSRTELQYCFVGAGAVNLFRASFYQGAK